MSFEFRIGKDHNQFFDHSVRRRLKFYFLTKKGGILLHLWPNDHLTKAANSASYDEPLTDLEFSKNFV